MQEKDSQVKVKKRQQEQQPRRVWSLKLITLIFCSFRHILTASLSSDRNRILHEMKRRSWGINSTLDPSLYSCSSLPARLFLFRLITLHVKHKRRCSRQLPLSLVPAFIRNSLLPISCESTEAEEGKNEDECGMNHYCLVVLMDEITQTSSTQTNRYRSVSVRHKTRCYFMLIFQSTFPKWEHVNSIWLWSDLVLWNYALLDSSLIVFHVFDLFELLLLALLAPN